MTQEMSALRSSNPNSASQHHCPRLSAKVGVLPARLERCAGQTSTMSRSMGNTTQTHPQEWEEQGSAREEADWRAWAMEAKPWELISYCRVPQHMSRVFITSGTWTEHQKQTMHITLKECFAATYGILSVLKIAKPKRLLLVVDSVAAQATVNRGSPVLRMNWSVQKAILEAGRTATQLSTAWVPSAKNPADGPSRAPLEKEDWQLLPRLFKTACHRLRFHPTVDMFASETNRLLPAFFSRQPQPGARGIDALQHNWGVLQDQGERLWMNPPFSLLGIVLDKVESECSQPVLLVTPDWPTRSWWSRLQTMTRDKWQLPPAAIYSRGGASRQPEEAPRWSTTVRLVGPSPCNRAEAPWTQRTSTSASG